MPESDVTRTLSVCTRKHLPVWAVASRYMLANIRSSDYVVIVPDADVALFSQATPKPFRVVPESLYARRVEARLKSAFAPEWRRRYGWYLQQFIKLLALDEARGDDVFLIWDSDTVPLKRLRFTADNKIGFYVSKEHHPPYFAQIEAVTGLGKQVPVSFIGQCMAVKASWYADMQQSIENRTGKPWLDALLDSVDVNQKSGFSEYELLGTYFAAWHRHNMFVLPGRWQRFGNSLIGGIANISDPQYAPQLQPYDFVAFETWDKGNVFSRARTQVAERPEA